MSEEEDASVHNEESGERLSHTCCMSVGRPGSVPFVSHRPGAFGRLLLAVYVRWKTGLLVSPDWLRPVTRGGGGLKGGPSGPSARFGRQLTRRGLYKSGPTVWRSLDC